MNFPVCKDELISFLYVYRKYITSLKVAKPLAKLFTRVDEDVVEYCDNIYMLYALKDNFMRTYPHKTILRYWNIERRLCVDYLNSGNGFGRLRICTHFLDGVDKWLENTCHMQPPHGYRVISKLKKRGVPCAYYANWSGELSRLLDANYFNHDTPIRGYTSIPKRVICHNPQWVNVGDQCVKIDLCRLSERINNYSCHILNNFPSNFIAKLYKLYRNKDIYGSINEFILPPSKSIRASIDREIALELRNNLNNVNKYYYTKIFSLLKDDEMTMVIHCNPYVYPSYIRAGYPRHLLEVIGVNYMKNIANEIFSKQ